MTQALLPESFTFCGRCFTQAELVLIQQVVSEFGALGINELSATVCELLEWKRPSGRLKAHEGRQLLDRLSQQGLVELPPLRRGGPQGPRGVAGATQWPSGLCVAPGKGGISRISLVLAIST